jgi:hypothetical protein
MSAGLLFVTAPEADYKTINLLLLHLRVWEHDLDDQYRFVTTKKAYDLEISPVIFPDGSKNMGETSPPLDSSLENAWAGNTIEDVEGFCLDLCRVNEKDDNGMKPNNDGNMFIIVDSQALEKREVVLASRASIWEGHNDDEYVALDKFMKMRVPWEALWTVWINLDLANVNWEEFTEDGYTEDGDEREIGRDSSPEDCWYAYRSSGDEDISEKDRKRRDDSINRMREKGQI